MQVIEFDQNDNFKFCSDVHCFKLEIEKGRIYIDSFKKIYMYKIFIVFKDFPVKCIELQWNKF